ncbi:MAG TPA: DUF2235 domain-containing protein [Longimicrobiales bacterium]|nr:DUF2235 domain-containing protein [Longimicrobiales bacterium]
MSRRLIVCSDGTWQSEDAAAPSNVCRLADRLADTGSDGKPQRVFYQSGVGTDPTRGRLNRKFSSVMGGGFGIGLDRNILDIYRWLMHEYSPGDELWFFGFSRGAYTVRSTVGLVRNCGILKPAYERLADRAMALYRARGSDSHPNAPRSRSFRRNYAHEVREVQFVGVWDTVGALGIPGWLGMPASIINRRHRFHDTCLSSIVRHAYHALAVDEQRRTFDPAIWKEPEGKRFTGTVEQTWFPGVHSDVGGGYPERAIADVTLCWMLDRAVKLGLGTVAEPTDVLAPDPAGDIHDSRWWVHRRPGIRRIATARRAIEPGDGQAAHAAVRQRMTALPEYRPENLLRAIEAGLPELAAEESAVCPPPRHP